MNENEYSSPPEVAKLLRVGHDKVLSFIAAGSLRAINVALSERSRPRWRIHRDDLQAFLERRAARPRPEPAPKRRPKLPAVKSYV